MSTKDRIDAAAIELFAARGIDGTAVRDIAKRAGVADGALYRHYHSKDELGRLLFARHYEELGLLFEAVAADRKDLAGKLANIIRTAFGLFDRDRALFSFILLAQHDYLPGIGELAATPVDAVQKLVAAAIENGEILNTDPDETTAMLFGLALQPAIFTIYGRLSPPLSKRADKVTDACCRLIGLDPAKEGDRHDT